MILTTNDYDVDTPEGASAPRATQHITLKDWKVISIAVIVFFVVSIPIYKEFRQQRDKQVCKTHMKGTYNAILQYAAVNGDRFPPIYTVGDNGSPYLVGGLPDVWATIVAPYMSRRDSFECSAAEEGEGMPALGTVGVEKKNISLTYGMYLPMSTMPYEFLSQDNATALIVETSNHGAMRSFNPVPFTDTSGKVVPFDAFMIGYDDSNAELTEKSKWVTRLAFRGADKGYLAPGVTPRHPKGIHVIYADGHLGTMFAPLAEVQNIYPDVEGMWRVR